MKISARSVAAALPPTVLGGATVFTLRYDGQDGFWVSHPMLGALISGALLFAFGVLVVEGWAEQRDARRWKAAAVAASRDLGHTLDEVLSTLWRIHSEPDPGPVERDSTAWTPAWRARDIEAASGRPRLPVRDVPQPSYEGVALTPADRLEHLLRREDFEAYARRTVDIQRDRLRDAAKEWAGLLMWSSHSQEILNALGVFAEKHLSRVGYHLHCQPHTSAAVRAEAVEQWQLADIKGRVLLNELWGANTSYRFAVPVEVADVTLPEAYRYEDSVGRWRPPPLAPMSRREHLSRRFPRWMGGTKPSDQT